MFFIYCRLEAAAAGPARVPRREEWVFWGSHIVTRSIMLAGRPLVVAVDARTR